MTIGSRSSFFLEDFYGFPRFVGGGLFVFERAIKIHLGQQSVGLEFEKAREQNFCLQKTALSEFVEPLFVRLEPLQELRVNLFVSSSYQRKDIHRFGLSFDLHPGNLGQMKFICLQLSSAHSPRNRSKE